MTRTALGGAALRWHQDAVTALVWYREWWRISCTIGGHKPMSGAPWPTYGPS